MTNIEEDSTVDSDTTLPTLPCSVVWCGNHAYVLEGFAGRSRWMGMDERGRPEALTNAELARRGWSRTRRAG
ncbi:MAG TPA: hypothetical protein VFO68_33865 [Actinophytocola sp.]|nr:hypothetical protein [Actinophytocola sp.]HET9144390.1 hypothetical protein [Actinophytocola sp.]